MSTNALPTLKTSPKDYHTQVGKKLDAWRSIIETKGNDENYFNWIRKTARQHDKLPDYALDIIELYICDKQRMFQNQ